MHEETQEYVGSYCGGAAAADTQQIADRISCLKQALMDNDDGFDNTLVEVDSSADEGVEEPVEETQVDPPAGQSKSGTQRLFNI